jgi:integrase/recombinase XerD
MKRHFITEKLVTSYRAFLIERERTEGTIEKYLRDISQFAQWLHGREVTQENLILWKEELLNRKTGTTTINGKLTALSSFFRFAGWSHLKVRYLKLQRKLFRDKSRELTKEEYFRLVRTAASLGRERLALLLETICSSGIRVSEVQYITVEAVREERAEIALKGKIRTILLPSKLCRKLRKYIRKNKIRSGQVFLTASGKPLCRKQIWWEMKRLCKKAGVEAGKVFPHNLRHLFARCFYRICKDLARLSDILGHSSVDTTRIYLISSGEEHAKTLQKMQLVG